MGIEKRVYVDNSSDIIDLIGNPSAVEWGSFPLYCTEGDVYIGLCTIISNPVRESAGYLVATIKTADNHILKIYKDVLY